MKVLVCGGRDLDNWRLVQRTLTATREKTGISVIIEGGANGADSIARRWAQQAHIPVMTFQAHWQTMGKRAGPVRNGWMVEFGRPDLVIAFPGGRGTLNMIEHARSAGIDVHKIGWKEDA